MDGTKDPIRQALRRWRRALPAAVVRRTERAVLTHLDGLAAYGEARAVLAYVATDNEVPTGALLRRAVARGKQVFLPRLFDERMTFAEYRRGEPLRPGRFGIPEPTGPAFERRPGEPVIVLVPVVAWSRDGGRLGRGGGHYDRALANLAGPACLVGLGYAFQQCATLPRATWDVRLDYVVTERAVMCCRGGGEPAPKRKEATNGDELRVGGRSQPGAGGGAGLAPRLPAPPAR